MKPMLSRLAAATVFAFTSLANAQAAEKNGTCLVWSEGDSQSLMSCEASSLAACGKGLKAITNKDTAFANYKGKLFRKKDDSSISEFRNEPPEGCRKERIEAARGVEATMSSQWGSAVYSADLKSGDKAYVYGKSVTLREEASSKSRAIGLLVDRAEATISAKSKEAAKIANLFDAHWFKITVDGKTGWIYGQFLHPDPNSQESFVSGGN